MVAVLAAIGGFIYLLYWIIKSSLNSSDNSEEEEEEEEFNNIDGQVNKNGNIKWKN